MEVGHLSSWTLLSRFLQVSNEGASTLEQVSAQVWVQVWVQVVHFLLSCAISSRELKVLAKPSLLSWVASINDSLKVLSAIEKKIAGCFTSASLACRVAVSEPNVVMSFTRICLRIRVSAVGRQEPKVYSEALLALWCETLKPKTPKDYSIPNRLFWNQPLVENGFAHRHTS